MYMASAEAQNHVTSAETLGYCLRSRARLKVDTTATTSTGGRERVRTQNIYRAVVLDDTHGTEWRGQVGPLRPRVGLGVVDLDAVETVLGTLVAHPRVGDRAKATCSNSNINYEFIVYPS